jgi:hypothetical protein
MSKKVDKVYAKFIAFSIKNWGGQQGSLFWKNYIAKKLGSFDLKEISSTKLRKTALSLYYIHFINLSMKMPMAALLDSNKSPEDLRDMFIDIEKLREKYGLPTLAVVNYTDFKEATLHMQKMQESTEIITSLETFGEKQPKITKAIVKAKAPAKTKAVGKKQPPMKIKAKDVDFCAMKLVDLKKLAADRGVAGRSKMTKDQLCKVLAKK